MSFNEILEEVEKLETESKIEIIDKIFEMLTDSNEKIEIENISMEAEKRIDEYENGNLRAIKLENLKRELN